MLTTLGKLKSCQSRKDLAKLLNIQPRSLSFALYKMSKVSRYSTYSIPKASGGSRLIHAPNQRLKSIQRRTSNLLYECYKEIYPKARNTNIELSHAFQKQRGLSIATNAAKHCNRRFVFNLDLQDFFGCFNFGRVRGYFLSNDDFRLNAEVATTLAQICCFENKLPQGAPTSPIVAELITRILDIRISKIASKNGCSYSRYADDLTFSTNKRTFPDDIARKAHDGTWVVGDELLNKIHNSGFLVNKSKTRMHFFNGRQEATGLTINKKVNVSKEYSKQVRYMCHSLFKTGTCFIVPPNSYEKVSVSHNVLGGKLAHIFHIKTRDYLDSSGKPFSLSHFRTKDKEYEIPAFYERYRQYINFRHFYYNQLPTILCEGKTDNIYLRCAIRANASEFPLLSSGGNKIECQFFNYTDTVKRVTWLTGGANPIKRFVEYYDRDSSLFTAPNGLMHPVIVVVDNDAANNGLKSYLKNRLNFQDNIFSEPYCHVTRNLFIVPIPKINGRDTVIEHLFKQQTLAEKLNGKSFDINQKQKISPNKYGKAAFARDVVQKKQSEIDFSGFLPLLKNVGEAIQYYRDLK